MHSILITAPNPFELEPGTRYLLSNDNAGQFLREMIGQDLVHFQGDDPTVWTDAPDIPLRNVLIIRAGGIGDLIFLTPTLHTLLTSCPETQFTLAAHPRYWPALNHPDLERLQLRGMDLTEDEVKGTYDAVFCLDDTIEGNDDDNAIDVFAKAILGSPDDLVDRQCRFSPHPDALGRVQEKHPLRKGEVRIGVQLHASHICRTYNTAKLVQAVRHLMQNPNVHIFMLSSPGMIENPEPHPQITWLTGEKTALPLDECLALVSTCHGFIAPDSGLCHVAGALGIPTVALFGAYHWKQRTGDFPSVRAIQGTGCPMGPCHHKGRSTPWPAGGPCNMVNACVAIDSIDPARIVSQLKAKMAVKHRDLLDAKTPSNPAPNAGTEPPNPCVIRSRFGPTRVGDVHPELPKADLYHLGDWGFGAANVEEAEFLFALVAALKPRVCIETGTETGWTAAHIAAALEANNRGHLWTVELDPAAAQRSQDNLDLHEVGSRVTVVNQSALDFIRDWAEWSAEKIDFALLDTHIPLRAEELAAIREKLSDNAIVAVHDTAPDHPMAEGTELLKQLYASGLNVIHLSTPRGLTLLQKGHG